MKIRNRHLIRAAGWLGSCTVKSLVRSLKLEVAYTGTATSPQMLPPDSKRHVYLCWHENLLLPVARFGCPNMAALISKHADGQLFSSLITGMGMDIVYGSTNRGGIEAVRKLMHDHVGRHHLAISPDGPRGPRRVVQPGAIYIASRAGMQIVCIGVGYDRPWRMKSWDRFAIPKPFSRARIVCGDLISVPEGLRSEGIETYRGIVQAEMDRLNGLAEDWAATGKLNVPESPPAQRLAS